MPELTVDAREPLHIGLTGMDAILQNMRVIVLTSMYSVPLDRAFAHLNSMVDSPSPHVTARLSARLVDALERYEPRIKVDGIRWQGGDLMQGRLLPVISFSLREGANV